MSSLKVDLSNEFSSSTKLRASSIQPPATSRMKDLPRRRVAPDKTNIDEIPTTKLESNVQDIS